MEVEVVGCLIHIHKELPQPSFRQIERTDLLVDSYVNEEGEGVLKQMHLVIDLIVIWIACFVVLVAYLPKKVVEKWRKKKSSRYQNC